MVDMGRGLDMNSPSNECNNEYNHCASRDIGITFVVERATTAEGGPGIAIDSPHLQHGSFEHALQHPTQPRCFSPTSTTKIPGTVHTPLT